MARRFTLDIKYGRKDMSRAADWFLQQWKKGLFRDFFGRDVAIVPAPKHAPVRPGAAWPIRDLVEEMGLRRLGQSCEWLQRCEKVVKSAHAPPGKRPSVEKHCKTIAIDVSVTPTIHPHRRITVLDDVITRGATLLACVIRLREYFPDATVCGFALVRTNSEASQIKKMFDPVQDGRITMNEGGWLKRDP